MSLFALTKKQSSIPGSYISTVIDLGGTLTPGDLWYSGMLDLFDPGQIFICNIKEALRI